MRHRRLLLLVLLIALTVRLWGIAFGLPAALARPDETQIAGPAVGYLGGNLEPPFFQWPTLFQYLVALVYVAYVVIGRPFGGYATLAAFAESRRQSLVPFLLIPRMIAVVLSVAAVWWVYRICRRTFDSTIGLIAALFLALAFLPVREAHFGLADAPMAALVLLAVLAILRWWEAGSISRAALAGIATGLAASTKYNGIIVSVTFVVAWVQRLVETGPSVRRHRTRDLVQDLLAYGGATVAAFLAGSPYVLLDWHRFIADTRAVHATLAGGHGLVLGPGWWYYPTAVLPSAVGWPILISALAGMAALLARKFRSSAVLFAFPLAYYLIAGQSYAVFARYILPVVPFLCVAAAWSVVSVVRRIARNWSPHASGALFAVGVVAVVSPTAWNTILLDRLLARTDNRVVVSRELHQIIPAGHSLYQSGESYGQVPLGTLATAAFDVRAGRFDPSDPDWVLLQRSPLQLYSAVPASLERIVKDRYVLQRAFLTGRESTGRRLYDQQDAFFLPLTGLDGLERPGPSFELYRRRD